MKQRSRPLSRRRPLQVQLRQSLLPPLLLSKSLKPSHQLALPSPLSSQRLLQRPSPHQCRSLLQCQVARRPWLLACQPALYLQPAASRLSSPPLPLQPKRQRPLLLSPLAPSVPTTIGTTPARIGSQQKTLCLLLRQALLPLACLAASQTLALVAVLLSACSLHFSSLSAPAWLAQSSLWFNSRLTSSSRVFCFSQQGCLVFHHHSSPLTTYFPALCTSPTTISIRHRTISLVQHSLSLVMHFVLCLECVGCYRGLSCCISVSSSSKAYNLAGSFTLCPKLMRKPESQMRATDNGSIKLITRWSILCACIRAMFTSKSRHSVRRTGFVPPSPFHLPRLWRFRFVSRTHRGGESAPRFEIGQ